MQNTKFALESRAGNFSALNASSLLLFSALAYKKDAYIADDLLAAGYYTPADFKDKSPITYLKNPDPNDPALRHGFIAVRGKQMVISFRGADLRPERIQEEFKDVNDWSLAGREEYGAYQKFSAEKKFDAILNEPAQNPSIASQVAEQVRAFLAQNPDGEIYMTGHSRGGALAQMMVGQMLQDIPGIDKNIAGIYTFGQPRCVNRDYAKFLNDRIGKKYFRVNHSKDLAAYIPISMEGNMHADYAHVGQEVSIDDGKWLFEHPPYDVVLFAHRGAIGQAITAKDVNAMQEHILKFHNMKTYLSSVFGMEGIGDNFDVIANILTHRGKLFPASVPLNFARAHYEYLSKPDSEDQLQMMAETLLDNNLPLAALDPEGKKSSRDMMHDIVSKLESKQLERLAHEYFNPLGEINKEAVDKHREIHSPARRKMLRNGEPLPEIKSVTAPQPETRVAPVISADVRGELSECYKSFEDGLNPQFNLKRIAHLLSHEGKDLSVMSLVLGKPLSRHDVVNAMRAVLTQHGCDPEAASVLFPDGVPVKDMEDALGPVRAAGEARLQAGHAQLVNALQSKAPPPSYKDPAYVSRVPRRRVWQESASDWRQAQRDYAERVVFGEYGMPEGLGISFRTLCEDRHCPPRDPNHYRLWEQVQGALKQYEKNFKKPEEKPMTHTH